MGYWEQLAEGRWRWNGGRIRPEPARSDLPMPHVISDIMDPVEQVDGKFYTSKAAFRAVGRAHGLTEVGNDPARLRKKTSRSTDDPTTKRARKNAIGTAISQYKAGRRVRLDDA